jgi:MoaA/NifB/PqqE/SkfB family radical SAM enzyme
VPVRFAQIEPTTRCNFTCGFCAGRSMRQGDLPWETFELFLSQNPALEHVELQGEGEPLMHPRFFDMVAALRARRVRVSLIANGSLLAQNADRLLAAGIESIDVSMESAVAVDFQGIRGGKLSKVTEGLRTLLGRRRELGLEQPVVGLAVTVLRRTLGAMEAIVALYRELGLDGGIAVQPLQRMQGYTENYDAEMLAQLVPDDAWRTYLERQRPLLASVHRSGKARRFYDDLLAAWHPSYGTCPWLDAGAYLTIDGEVRACAFLKHSEDAFGTVMDPDPAPGMARRRSLLAETIRSGKVPAPCTGCALGSAAAELVVAARRLYSP